MPGSILSTFPITLEFSAFIIISIILEIRKAKENAKIWS